MTVAEKEPPPPVSITPRQREVYDWIVDHCETKGYGPTIRDGMRAFGLKSANGFLCHLDALERKGWIIREKYRSRTIRPIGGTR